VSQQKPPCIQLLTVDLAPRDPGSAAAETGGQRHLLRLGRVARAAGGSQPGAAATVPHFIRRRVAPTLLCRPLPIARPGERRF
jgi:hypothetical protein